MRQRPGTKRTTKRKVPSPCLTRKQLIAIMAGIMGGLPDARQQIATSILSGLLSNPTFFSSRRCHPEAAAATAVSYADALLDELAH